MGTKGYIHRPPVDVIRDHRLFLYQLEYLFLGLYFVVTNNPHIGRIYSNN